MLWKDLTQQQQTYAIQELHKKCMPRVYGCQFNSKIMGRTE